MSALLAKIRAQIMERMGTWFTKGLAVLVLAAIFFIALGGVSHNEKWRIDDIVVTGVEIVSPADITTLVQQELLGNYFWAYARDNSFLFPKLEIEHALLEKFPRLEAVVVKRIDAHTVNIIATERKPYGLWCGEIFNAEPHELLPCWFIDDEGFIFDKAPIISQGVYLEVYGAIEGRTKETPIGGRVPEIRFSRADNLAELLRTRVGDPLRILLKSDGEFEIVMQSSAQYSMLANVILKLKDEMVPVTIVDTLISAMNEEFPTGAARTKKLLYVDMRFGNKIFFGFAN
jgi:hypothetical protein